MYSSNSKYYVFKKSTNKTIALTYGEKSGICYSNLTKKNTWTTPVSIEKQAREPFSACMDTKDIIHIIYQDSHGNIFYIQLDEASIFSLPMLGSKYPSPYNKFFNILAVKNNIHCFYVLLHNNKYLLTHQVISNKEVKNPQALGYINKNNLPYAVHSSRSGDIYVFYQNALTSDLQQQASAFQIGCRKYSLVNQRWEEFIPISPSDLSLNAQLKFDYPSIIIDNADIIHITYQKFVADRYELVYRQKPVGDANWSTETVIHTSLNSFEDSSIICINDKIIIFWVRNDTIYYSYSADRGNTWSKPNRYNFPVGRQLSCICYQTNDFYEVNRIITNEIPGSFINGLKLAFCDDMLSSEVTDANKDGFRNVISDNLKVLHNTLDELIEVNNNIKTDIKRLKLFNTNILREIDKIYIKLNYLENQIKQKRMEQKRMEQSRIWGGDYLKSNINKNDLVETDFEKQYANLKKQEISNFNETDNESDTYEEVNKYDEAKIYDDKVNTHNEVDTYLKFDANEKLYANENASNDSDKIDIYDKNDTYDEADTNTNEES